MADYRDKLFSEYYESSYKYGNILTPEQFELASGAFDRDYADFILANKDAAILDFGCGVGHFLCHLKKKGYTNFRGIDISGQQVEYCRTHISDKVEVVDGRDFLKHKTDIYDLILVHDVLEHIAKSEIIPLLELMHHALKNGGRLIVRVPNMSNPFGLDARFNDFTHEVGFTFKSLQQVLIIAGFSDVQILPLGKIIIRSFKNLVRSGLLGILHHYIRFCYYIQDYTVPNNLDKNIVAVACKS